MVNLVCSCAVLFFLSILTLALSLSHDGFKFVSF